MYIYIYLHIYTHVRICLFDDAVLVLVFSHEVMAPSSPITRSGDSAPPPPPGGMTQPSIRSCDEEIGVGQLM